MKPTERRYTIYLTNNKQYDMDEADLEKLKRDAPKGSIVILKQVAVNPSCIVAIEPRMEEASPLSVKALLNGEESVRLDYVVRPLTDRFNPNKALPVK